MHFRQGDTNNKPERRAIWEKCLQFMGFSEKVRNQWMDFFLQELTLCVKSYLEVIY